MPSGIPTRRAPRRADENAPPPAGSVVTRTRSRAALPGATNPALAKPTATTSIPVMKRQRSAASSASQENRLDKPDASAAARRNALGEVRNGKGEKEVAGGKAANGKAVVREERKPLATTQQAVQGAPRTRAANAALPAGVAVKEDKVTGKRKAVAPAASSKIPSRSRSATAASGASVEPTASAVSADERAAVSQAVDRAVKAEPLALRDHASNVPGAVAPVPEDEEPVRKRRKTSSPAPTPEEDEGGLFEEEGPQVDGTAVLLSSGSKNAVGLRSPKKAKDEGWWDLDAEDEGDPTMVAEYVVDAFKYMMDIQTQTMPKADYMDKQAELQWKMRQILMDWLIEVHSKFRLLPETLFITSNLVDRFLSKRVISLVKFQLVGLTALFIAAKYEEVCCPGVEHFLHMSDGGYTIEELLKAERYMLSTLEFDLSYPNPLNFIRRISKADGYDIQTRTVAKYLVEISCVDHRLLPFEPSMLAAASMWLARLCLERGDWGPNLVHYSTYSQEEILPCAQVMLDYILNPEFEDTTSFYKKYASKKHMKASVYVREWAISYWPDSANGAGGDEQGNELKLLIASSS
ncbi:hypothetical protein IAT38_005361 [Cryptococcus sp. DSM 104549]